MLVTKKTADKLGGLINDGAGSAVSNFARRQMEKMGWSEGKGLGKNEDGIAKHIKVAKREDAAGLGTEAVKAEAVNASETWWHDDFSHHLKKFGLSKTNGKKSSKKRNLSVADDSEKNVEGSAMPSYAELFAATGGARLGMRARAKQPGKHARTEGAAMPPPQSSAENNSGIKTLSAVIIDQCIQGDLLINTGGDCGLKETATVDSGDEDRGKKRRKKKNREEETSMLSEATGDDAKRKKKKKEAGGVGADEDIHVIVKSNEPAGRDDDDVIDGKEKVKNKSSKKVDENIEEQEGGISTDSKVASMQSEEKKNGSDVRKSKKEKKRK
jgi:Pin2-interacting protein X1